jgi:myosin heavy subunit
MDSIDDLATLSQLDENILLNELKRRYVEKKIYVSIGTEFLLSVHD